MYSIRFGTVPYSWKRTKTTNQWWRLCYIHTVFGGMCSLLSSTLYINKSHDMWCEFFIDIQHWMSCVLNYQHDDVIKWKHFPRNWPFVRGIHRSPVNSPHKGQWRGALMFSLICAWIHDWVNNREAGDLRGYRAHYDAIVMNSFWHINFICQCNSMSPYACSLVVLYRLSQKNRAIWRDM